MEGFVRREDDWTGKFWDVLVYDRELNSIQCDHYDLVLIGMDQARESMLL
jgi:hypothetical protein